MKTQGDIAAGKKLPCHYCHFLVLTCHAALELKSLPLGTCIYANLFGLPSCCLDLGLSSFLPLLPCFFVLHLSLRPLTLFETLCPTSIIPELTCRSLFFCAIRKSFVNVIWEIEFTPLCYMFKKETTSLTYHSKKEGAGKNAK